jgi:periplasmic divalent cation tolerance protein
MEGDHGVLLAHSLSVFGKLIKTQPQGMAMSYISVTTTVQTFEDAENIARALVSQRLAACVHLTPCHSVYRWQGKVHDDNEHVVSIKTRRDLYPQLEAYLRDTHRYELPEILVTPIIDGSAEYLNWLENQLLAREE